MSIGEQKCPKCGETKPLPDFHNSPVSKSGRASYCKICHKENVREWKLCATVKEKNLDVYLKYKYGLSLEEYNETLEKQGGVCAICKKHDTKVRLHVDHCHSTQIFRGLLCTKCNQGLGSFKEDEEALKNAVVYLQKSVECTRILKVRFRNGRSDNSPGYERALKNKVKT